MQPGTGESDSKEGVGVVEELEARSADDGQGEDEGERDRDPRHEPEGVLDVVGGPGKVGDYAPTYDPSKYREVENDVLN